MPCGATQTARDPSLFMSFASKTTRCANIVDGLPPPRAATSIARFMSKCVTSTRLRSCVRTHRPGPMPPRSAVPVRAQLV